VLHGLSVGNTFFAGPVKNSFKHIDPEFMFVAEMSFDFFQKAAVRMDEATANFTFQMKMFPAICPVVYVLITSAFVFVQDIFADLPLDRQFFKMPVDGRLPDCFFRILKIADYLADRYMAALKGFQIIKNTLSLPSAVIYRTFMRHRIVSYHGG
jgi:hypothetical protein